MRETRSSGSVEGVVSNGYPYSDSQARFAQDDLPLIKGSELALPFGFLSQG